MGVVGGFIEGFVGLWVIGMAVVFMQPIWDMMDAIAVMFGATTNPTYIFVTNTMQYVLIIFGIALIINAFSRATETEEQSYVYR
ncbi:hypothetical protein J2755_000292 [Methanohalophilus levihalophilus]|uniref:hypothetical protein n=1 Tax=Methanohalophilus levihalophilus TaxID=1431282 RepID=UPI001AE8BDC8|nr:hypothetical protein [Methanohalophilus levihalophilus]MBP2029372.1 hypothetical protein [Methanohalophilus levihalophilus]